MRSYFSDVQFRAEISQSELTQLLNDLAALKPEAIVILIASESGIELSRIPELAAQYDFPVYGLICAGVIYSDQYSYDGLLALAFDVPVQASLIENLDMGRAHVERALESYIRSDEDYGTSIVFIDGMSSHVEEFVITLYDQLGDQCGVLGAGLGYKSFEALPCIADKSGCYQNSALILSVINGRQLPSVGAHGWGDIVGPLLITSARNNKVMELNYQPAFEVYKEAIASYCDIELTEENFQQVSNSFPFGLKQLEKEFLVRDPILLDGQCLEFVGNLEENSLVYVLHSNKKGLVEAATEAAKVFTHSSRLALAGRRICETHNVLVIDCISRSLFLGEDFQLELGALQAGLPSNSRMLGLLSLGEIKNTDQGAIQFLNKTLVLGGL